MTRKNVFIYFLVFLCGYNFLDQSRMVEQLDLIHFSLLSLILPRTLPSIVCLGDNATAKSLSKYAPGFDSVAGHIKRAIRVAEASLGGVLVYALGDTHLRWVRSSVGEDHCLWCSPGPGRSLRRFAGNGRSRHSNCRWGNRSTSIGRPGVGGTRQRGGRQGG